MKRLIPLVLLLLLTTGAKGQLRSVGDVPADLKMSVQELYDADMRRAKKYAGKRVKNKQTVLEASYNVNKMLAGGHIVYGDPLSHMVERIADTLLADYPELRSELRFYTVTSPDVNAYATGQGMVFVNTGLIAQVDDEAQLAFILSHEIVHYYRSHSLEKIVGKKKSKQEKADLEEATNEVDNFMRHHNRSREMENEADSLGIAMFYLRSPYAKDVSEGVFDVLQYSELPFDDLPFDTTLFNTQWYTLGGCWLDSVAPITSRDNYDDSRSTHPNIISRRQKCAEALDGYYGGERYVVCSKDEFNRLRRMARLESIRQETIHGEYAHAFYNTWITLKDSTITPQDRHDLEIMAAQQLYGIAVFKDHDNVKSITTDYTKIEGESQQVHYAVKKMTPEQATLAALHYTWTTFRRYPDNIRLQKMAYGLMDELRLSNKKSITDFMTVPPSNTDADTTAQTSDDGTQRQMTKYERIKQKRAVQTKRNPTSYALTDLLATDAAFGEALRTHLGAHATPPEDPYAIAKDTSATIVFNTTYRIFDNKNDEMQVLKSDRREAIMSKHIANINKSLGHRVVDLSDEGMHKMESDVEYNDFLTMCEWSNEFWLANDAFVMERLTQPAMDRLLDRYGARTVGFNVLLNVEGLSADANPTFLLVLPLTPLVAVCMFTGIEHTAMATVVVDAREGKVLSRQSYSFNVADHDDMVDAMIYDNYSSALHPKKSENKGFMGKRLALAGGFNLGAAGYQTFSHGHYLALTPWASVEFAIGRTNSIALWGRYNKGYEEITQSSDPYWYGNAWQTNTFQSSKNMLTLAVDMRKYTRSEFAPLGLYVGGGLHMVRFTDFDGNADGQTFGAHLGLGRNYVFLHRLVLNYEVSYAYTYGLFSKVVNKKFDGDASQYMHYADAVVANMLTIRLGIGFLPF